MNLVHDDRGFRLSLGGRLLLAHAPDRPCLFVGRGDARIHMHRGNFDISDRLEARLPLVDVEISPAGEGWSLVFSLAGRYCVPVLASMQDGRLVLEWGDLPDGLNRAWLRLAAEPDESVYGCGEQFSHLDLRGRHFPLWTSEQGVGRNKNSLLTFQMDQLDHAGGDYFWTFFPQPTFLSTRGYYCHVDGTAYMDFDFSHEAHHELAIWDCAARVILEVGSDFLDLVKKISALLGRQPELPEWVYHGLWLGIQGGTRACQEKLDRMQAAGVRVGAVWAQDWQGIRMTSFGQRLMWNWEWSPERYPDLDRVIREWRGRGIRFLGYINPYVAVEGSLYREASERGFLARNAQGGDYLVEFGEFWAGVVDLTNPDAFAWYKGVIRRNLIDFGLSGWMADFGEYLPTDVCLHNGVPAEIMHNAWPALWARCNHEAVSEAGRLGDIVFFMRAGGTGSQRWCPLLWAGDQNVDWSLDDGLASVIPAALSVGLCGCGLHHSDIGGYTTFPQFDLARSKELLLRWVDFAAFTPVMRTHEGNRPEANWQFDSDDETISHFARMTRVYVELAPYVKALVAQNAREGVPVMRPLFMHYPDDARSHATPYQYLYGPDLLVAPVHQPQRSTWTAWLPPDEWVHLWSGRPYDGGEHEVDAPLGRPPVFYRQASEHVPLFQRVGLI